MKSFDQERLRRNRAVDRGGGTQIQFGIAAPVPAWSTQGGGLQIQLLGRIPAENFQFWDVLPYK